MVQVEFYFGESETPLGYYSHRNELEAINLILMLANTSLSRQMHNQMNVGKELRDAIIHKIQEFGNRIKEDAKINKSYTCEKEKCLVQWGVNNGVKTKLEIACKFSRLRSLLDVFLPASGLPFYISFAWCWGLGECIVLHVVIGSTSFLIDTFKFGIQYIIFFHAAL